MSETARADILSRVRVALATTSSAGVIPAAPLRTPVPDLLAHFSERVEDYRAVVVRTTQADLAGAVGTALGHGESTTGDGGSVVVPPGLGIEVPGARVDDPASPLSSSELDGIMSVVTRARVGIAETGTIVLDHTPDQGRRVISLLPDRHVCVVAASQVVLDVPDALAVLDPSRPMTWISGPSATSDIELDRVEGVHGPRSLIVILVMDR